MIWLEFPKLQLSLHIFLKVLKPSFYILITCKKQIQRGKGPPKYRIRSVMQTDCATIKLMHMADVSLLTKVRF